MEHFNTSTFKSIAAMIRGKWCVWRNLFVIYLNADEVIFKIIISLQKVIEKTGTNTIKSNLGILR